MTSPSSSSSSAKARQQLRHPQHWVIKIGSNVLLDPARPHGIDRGVFVNLVKGIDALLTEGYRVTLVSSGAVALGRQALSSSSPTPPATPSTIPYMQALAAIGQPRLLKMYEDEFAQYYDRRVAQLLFTRQDLDDRARYLNARHTLDALHRLGVLPIINENDTVATDELRFGDNDRLAAMTCGLVRAQVLVILSDVSGIFEVTHTPAGERQFGDTIDVIPAYSSHLDVVAGPSESGVGTGGMVSKVGAARLAASLGVSTIIASGRAPDVLRRLSQGEAAGTLLLPPEDESSSGRKVWLRAGARAMGQVHCDEGAYRALKGQGASLLPSGVVRVEGVFSQGAVVDLMVGEERIGRGVSVYDAGALRRIAGAKSSQIEDVLGYALGPEAVHRDHLVLMPRAGESEVGAQQIGADPDHPAGGGEDE